MGAGPRIFGGKQDISHCELRRSIAVESMDPGWSKIPYFLLAGRRSTIAFRRQRSGGCRNSQFY